MTHKDYQLVIGLEIHAQINSPHKLFSLAQNSSSGEFGPNTTITRLEMGIPGVLPVVNKDPIIQAIKAGLAFNGTINQLCFFDRKHYFYPDLPTGYQITQFFVPIVENAYLEIPTVNGPKKIRIKQMHIEADAGKNNHMEDCSLLDGNRVMVGLIETVTEPDISSPEEAVAFAQEFHNILNYIGVCSGDMEKGNFRMDVNISAKDLTNNKQSNRVEIKNLNSFNNMIKAINYEYERHINALKNNEIIPQSTRFFDAEKGKTGLLRLKESSGDYMYIRENDLPGVVIDESMMNEAKTFLQNNPLPKDCRKILMEYGLSEKQSYDIVSDKNQWNHFYELLKQVKTLQGFNKDMMVFLYNLWTLDLASLYNKTQTYYWDSCLTAKNIMDLMMGLHEKKITMASYKILLEKLWHQKGDVNQLIIDNNMATIQDNSVIINAVKEAIEKNPQEFQRYKNGETKLFQFFVGQVMKITAGKANPDDIRKFLSESLDN